MTDIVERLRATPCDREPFTSDHANCQCRLANKAANRIEDLEAEIKQLRDRVAELEQARTVVRTKSRPIVIEDDTP